MRKSQETRGGKEGPAKRKRMSKRARDSFPANVIDERKPTKEPFAGYVEHGEEDTERARKITRTSQKTSKNSRRGQKSARKAGRRLGVKIKAT